MEWSKGRGADTGKLSLRVLDQCSSQCSGLHPDPQTDFAQGILPLSLPLTTRLGAAAPPSDVHEGLEFKTK